MPSQEIHKIRDGTPLEIRKEWRGFYFSNFGRLKKFSKFVMEDVPSNVLQKKKVARILFFKIWPSQEILKIRDGTHLEAEEILTYRKSPRNGSIWHFSSKLDVPSNVLQKKRVARIQFFKIRPSQEIHKIRDGTPLEAEEILTYRKSPRNGSVWYFSSKLDVPSNILQKKRVAQILFFKIRPYQEILKIRDDVPSNVLQKKRVAQILIFKIRPSQEILKIRDDTHLEAEEILTYRKSPRNGSIWHFSSKLDVPSNVLQKKRVARIQFFKIRPSQEIHKIRDGIPLELDVPSKVLQKKRVARILVFKIRPSQEILKIRDDTHLEAEEILTYRKSPRNGPIWHFSSKLDVPSNKKRVARILFFKIWPSQKILKIRDGTPLEAEEILTYRKSPRNGSVWYFSSKLDVPSNVLQKKRVAWILVFKIRPSQEILKIRDGTYHPLEAEEILTYRKKPSKLIGHLKKFTKFVMKKRVARIMVFKIRPSQEILRLRDGTPLEAEEILTYRKSPRNGSVWHFSSKLDVPNNILQKKRVARILFFKIWPSQEILKIRDGPIWSNVLQKKRVAQLGHLKKFTKFVMIPRNGPVWYFSSKLDVPSNVLQKKRVARIMVFKITPSQEILRIRDGTPLEAEEILTYRKSPRNGSWHEFYFSKFGHLKKFSKFVMDPFGGGINFDIQKKALKNGSVWYFSTKLDVPSNVLQKKRVAQLGHLKKFTKSVMEEKSGTIRPSQEIHKIRDGTPLEAEEILTYRKIPQNGSIWYFSSKLDVPSKVLQKKRVARILVFKIRPSQEILKIRDGAHLEAEEILTYRKKP
ncbi:hypothetical protein OROMI_001048 [Orobanche minor]